jgi:hypothetical protein
MEAQWEPSCERHG